MANKALQCWIELYVVSMGIVPFGFQFPRLP